MTARRAILTAVLATAVPGFIRAQPAPTDSNAVRRVVHQWWTTVDPATYGSVHAVEATSIEPDGNVVRGRTTLQEEFAADLVNFKDYRVDSVTIASLRFLGSDHALVQGAFRVVGPRPPLWRYVFLGVLARTAGTWQVVGASHTRVGGCCQ